MNRLHLTAIPLVLGAGLLLTRVAINGPGDPPLRTSAGIDSLDDGPHVFWLDAGHPIAFYLCAGAFNAVQLPPQDTVAFTGLCADSTTEYRIARGAPAPARDTWRGVRRILALSDIHGEYDAMVTFLQRAGVVDSAGHWAWRDGHLVVLGDLLDRGSRVTECLWFLYRLEREALHAGGRVHVVLGNHEVMVMRDDLRYTNARYLDGIVRYSGIRYQDLFGPDMELGRWLRSKPLVLKLNDILFVHGGLAPELVTRDLSISKLNAIARASIGLSSAALVFSDVPYLLLGKMGPLWYRGYVSGLDGQYAATTDAQLDSVRQFYDASTIVIGHTETGQVTRLHDGRVYALDVSLETLGTFQGLLWEKGVFSFVSGMGTVEPWTDSLPPARGP